jgi:hypothetical protein
MKGIIGRRLSYKCIPLASQVLDDVTDWCVRQSRLARKAKTPDKAGHRI